MKVHLFGATLSPARTTYGLLSLRDTSINPNTLVKSFIRKNLYVDDGLMCFPDTDCN